MRLVYIALMLAAACTAGVNFAYGHMALGFLMVAVALGNCRGAR